VNILIISQYFWPENFRINDLSLGLIERGHQVTVLTGIPNYPQGRYFPGYGLIKNTRQDYQGVKVLRVPLVPRGRGGRVRLALNYLSFASCAGVLAPLICRERYDLIFVYEPSPITVGLPALVLKHLKSIPIMFWVQDLWPESLAATGAVHSKHLLKLAERFVRLIYQGCDIILVQSEAFFQPIKKMELNNKKILYYPNSAEELYQPATLEPGAPERDQMPQGFRVMFAGNIGAAQDFSTILAAADKLRHYPDIHWLILGDGRMRPWVEEKVRELELTKIVHLLGRHPAESMPRYFSLAHALLVTLKRDPIFALTIPSKIQSYLACGIPVIAALDGEGGRIISEAGAGVACPAESPERLADAVLSIYRMSDEERRNMGLRGRQYFEKNFERTMLLDQLDTWMRELQKETSTCAS
jgi:colanic acid biosynthesis glycosyl transferase WcaI